MHVKAEKHKTIVCVDSMLVDMYSKKRRDSIATACFSWKQKGAFKRRKSETETTFTNKKMGELKTKEEQDNVTVLE